MAKTLVLSPTGKAAFISGGLTLTLVAMAALETETGYQFVTGGLRRFAESDFAKQLLYDAADGIRAKVASAGASPLSN